MDNWFLANMETLLFNEKFHDVTFGFPNDEKIFAHAVILSLSSEVFSAQLSGPLREPNINITDSDADTFRIFLRFLYTGQLQITLENMFDLAQLGQKYMVPRITNEFNAFFEEKLRFDSNFCKLFCTEKMEDLEEATKETLLKLLLSRAPKILTSPAFLTLSAEQVGELVRSEDLAVHEFDLYKAVVRWAQDKCLRQNVEATTRNMREHVKDFIRELRMPTLRHNELLMADGICQNNLLFQLEKQALLFFCAGETSKKLGFEVEPRRASLDLIVAAAQSELTGSVVGTPHSTFFMPRGNFRFVGLSFVIEVTFPEGSKVFPVNVDFELKYLLADGNGTTSEPVCCFSFNYLASWTPEKETYTVYYPPGGLFPLYANRKYELVSRCGSGVRMQAFSGRYEKYALFRECFGESPTLSWKVASGGDD